jgi:hypothetical protein
MTEPTVRDIKFNLGYKISARRVSFENQNFNHALLLIVKSVFFSSE